jgi:short chain dehydrogenase
MPTQQLAGTTALVTGASRGFGRAIAITLAKQGAHVVGVARDCPRLEELRAQLGGTFTPVADDAADPVIAGQLLDKHRPRTLILNAGATPLTQPVHRQTWRGRSHRLHRQAGRRHPYLPGPPRPGAYPGASGHRDRRPCHLPRRRPGLLPAHRRRPQPAPVTPLATLLDIGRTLALPHDRRRGRDRSRSRAVRVGRQEPLGVRSCGTAGCSRLVQTPAAATR